MNIFILHHPVINISFFVVAHCMGCALISFQKDLNNKGYNLEGFMLFSEKEIKHYKSYSKIEKQLSEFKKNLIIHLN